MKTILLAIASLLLIGFGYWFFTRDAVTPASIPATILSFEDCMNAGNPIMESYPRQCKTADGRTYAEEITIEPTYLNATKDMVVVETPYPGAVTGKEFLVKGKARGTWFFEASFPVVLLDAQGNTLATGVAQAEGEWMTENFVPFTASLKAPQSYIGPATLVLKKDNPSGDAERDASISFPITIEY